MALDFTYLATLELDRNLTIPDSGAPGIIRTMTRTLGGMVDQKKSITVGREMTITATYDGAYYGFFTYAQNLSIKAIRDIGDAVLLRHHAGEWMVKILEVNLEFPRPRGANIPDSTRMFGTIQLITTE